MAAYGISYRTVVRLLEGYSRTQGDVLQLGNTTGEGKDSHHYLVDMVPKLTVRSRYHWGSYYPA